MTAAEHKSDFELTKDAPYLTFMGYEVSIVRIFQKIDHVITAPDYIWIKRIKKKDKSLETHLN